MTNNTQDTTYSVLLVDDSNTVRKILRTMLSDNDAIVIAGEAENGLVAIEKAKELQPDIIILDIEMPQMDGITALPKILTESPNSQIIIFSTLTQHNAEIGLKAMSIGAADYMQKPSSGLDQNDLKKELIYKIKSLGFVKTQKNLVKKKSNDFIKQDLLQDQANKKINTKRQEPKIEPQTPSHNPIQNDKIPPNFTPKAIAIASSTGGPQALDALFSNLKNDIPNIPIFITQHMPPIFTQYLANNLSTDNNIECFEAKDNMEVQPGKIYIAPGDYHMIAKEENNIITINLNQEEKENFCRPAADPMLRSLTKIYKNNLLVVILTGMGQDGLNGSIEAKKAGSIILAQDKESSVVWGMPGAVYKEGITNAVLPIEELAKHIIELCNNKEQ